MKKAKKEFLLGAMVGGMIGVAAVKIGTTKGKKAELLQDTLAHVSKAISAAGMDNNIGEIIDWTLEGVQMWQKLNKKRR